MNPISSYSFYVLYIDYLIFINKVPNVCSVYQKNMNIIDEKVNFIINRMAYLVKEVENVSNAPLTKCIKK